MQKLTHQTHSFDDFTLDLTRGCLLRDGEEIKLRPQTFATIKFLIENSGRLISKDELIKAVWPDWNASDNQLARCLSELRQALGDDEQRYIKTVPRRGYIFDAQVREEISATSGAVYTEQVEGIHVVINEEEDERARGLQAIHPTSSAEYLTLKLKKHKNAAALALAVLLVAVLGIAFGLYKFIARERSTVKPDAAFQTMKISRITNTGGAADAAITPDGKYIFHVLDEGGRESIWMRQVATSSDVQIIPPKDVRYWGLAFPPDGVYLYYNVSALASDLYRIPALGGVPGKVLTDLDSVITFSPDGKQLAFVRSNAIKGESALLTANADGTGERALAVRKSPNFFGGPAWSPDGRVIACAAETAGVSVDYTRVVEVQTSDGAVTPMAEKRWSDIGRMAWLRDGSGLILNASDQQSSPRQIWYLPLPGGKARRITNDLNNYFGMSVTADSAAVVTVQTDILSNMWIAPNGLAATAKQITFGKYEGVEGMSWTPDGRIVYAANVTGHLDIYIMNADGTNQKQLTAEAGNNSLPSVSADGRYILFMSDRTGLNHIWRMVTDGSNPKQLTNGTDERRPSCSPDGKWVVYASLGSWWNLWKVPIDGGDPIQLTDKPSGRPAISPDGKLIACGYSDEESGPLKIAVVPFEGGQPLKEFEIPPTVFDHFFDALLMRWTPDGRSLSFMDTHEGVSNIWRQPLDGGPPKQMTDFKTNRMFFFDWSSDGKQLVCSRGVVNNDVVLISNFR